ncbi:MAG: hypothetical protein H0T59_01815 [Chloroflexi bacterium]|nr:hypothetical protein [Chloroflexota bacterium]
MAKRPESPKRPRSATRASDPADEATIVARKMSRAVAERFVETMRHHSLWTPEPEVHLPL